MKRKGANLLFPGCQLLLLSFLILPFLTVRAQENYVPGTEDRFIIEKSIRETKRKEKNDTVYHISNDPRLQQYTGRWEWRSAAGDTLLVVELTDEEIYQRASEKIIRENKESPDKTHIIQVNRIFGKYEYSIGDSVLYSNLYKYPTSEGETPLSPAKERKAYLFGLFDQPDPEQCIYLTLRRNPLSQTHATKVLKFSLNEPGSEEATWEMYALDKDESTYLSVYPTTPEEIIFPTSITLKK
ncbi:MAG: hypothetical protein LUE93_01790 [Bacteroides sp.]|nr:hypothetical protein [Bacteroides sp.]